MSITQRVFFLLVAALVAPALACSSDDPANTDGGGKPRDGAVVGDGALDDDSGKDKGDGSPDLIDTLEGGLPSCGMSTLDAAPRTANVLLVIDESGSMTDKPSGFDVDKWSALKTALASALEGVQDENIAFGLELFPHAADASKSIPLACTSDCCEMPAAPGIQVSVEAAKTAVPKILSALGDSAPGGGTPTALALTRAYEYFTTGSGASLEGDKYVLLATDGGPNCNSKLTCDATSCTTNLDGDCSISGGNCCDPMFGGAIAQARCLDDDATLAQVEKLAGKNIQTFVVGIPGAETYASSLDAFAVAGGRENPAPPPKYFAVKAAGGVAGLTNVLSLITQNVITSCDLQLGSVPPNPDQLNVYVDGRLVKQSGDDGWELDRTSTPPTVVLKGATCEKVQSEGAQNVRILYGCPTVE